MTRLFNILRPSPHGLAIGLAMALAAMYGAVPMASDLFGIPASPPQYVGENAWGCVLLVLIIGGVGYASRGHSSARNPSTVSPIIAAAVFVGGCLWLGENKWVDVREGLEGTISAIFRILWFVVIISLDRQRLPLVKRMVYAIATVVLMFFDQSRTYFLIALLVLLADLGVSMLVPAILAALVVAAVRSGEDSGLINSVMFAVGGEGSLGSRGVFQVLAMGDGGINFNLPAIQALFSPITAPFALIGKRFDYPVELFDSSSYLGFFIKFETGETYPPMGGFFILSEFVRAGALGVICMAIYIFLVYYITKRLFDTAQFPIGSFISILAIKSSPMTYWNLVFAVFFVIVAFRTSKKAAAVPISNSARYVTN